MFLALMRKLASFTGIRILTYALMSNHYHIECEVPEAFELCDEDLLARIEALYGAAKREKIARKLNDWTHERGVAQEGQRIRESFLRRMFDVSEFNKELKGRFAQWYNKRHGRTLFVSCSAPSNRTTCAVIRKRPKSDRPSNSRE
jgi:hypothetical protein